MKGNTQILTFDLFKRICISYKQNLEFYKNGKDEKEDNLESFSEFLTETFKRYNIDWNGDFQKLYSLYLYSNSNNEIDFADLGVVSQSFYDYLAIAQPAGFFLNNEDRHTAFSNFVEASTSAKKINEETRRAIYNLQKFAEFNDKMPHAEIENLMNVITDKRNKLNLRKKHPIRDFIIKKGGTLMGIAAGVFAGIAIGTAGLPVGGIVAASAASNAITFGILGGASGGVLSYVGIKLKNIITKRHYRNKYNSSEKDFINIENGTISTEDLKINKLIEKVHETNKKISDLKKPCNKIVGFFRKIKRTALNISNRNRIHTISDELQNINNRINEILSSDLTDGERFARVKAFAPIRDKIATIRAKELVTDVARLLSTNKPVKIENLDIYAKDILRDEKTTKAQEKAVNKKIATKENARTTADTDLSDNKVSKKENVKTKAREILESIFRRDGTLLAGKYMFGCGVDIHGKLYTPVEAEGVINKLDAYNEVFNEVNRNSLFEREILEPEEFNPNTSLVAERVSQFVEIKEDATEEKPVETVVEEVKTEEIKTEKVEENVEQPAETTQVEKPVVEEPVVKETVVEEKPVEIKAEQRIIRKMVLGFKVKPILKKGEAVGKRLEVSKTDGTKETFKFNGESTIVDYMIASTVQEIIKDL